MASSAQIIAPYSKRRIGRPLRAFKLFCLFIYCALTGAAVALLPAQLLFLLAVPLLVAVGVILWMMPDSTRPVAVAPMAGLMVAFVAANCLWPNYLAIDLPGLPWINPPRIVVFALLTIALYSYATSSEMRAEVTAAIGGIRFLRTAFWLFWAMTVVTIVLSGEPAFSLNKWANNQIFWTFMFLIAAWLGTKGGVMERVVRVLVWTAILVACETIYEAAIEQVPWMDHIPSFLKVDEAYLANVLKAQNRAGTDVYRARGTFSVSLICAEYLAIVYPFLIHAAIEQQRLWKRAALVLGMLAMLSAMWLTNARSAMIGFFMSVFLYGGFAALRYWRRNRRSVVGVGILSLLPLFAAAFFALALVWPRLHNMTFGGAQHQPSTEARNAQWSMGLPKVRANPVGHGAARAGTTLGYANGAGQLTIDTYYLSLLLEYGVVGFAAFMAMFGGQLVYGLRLYFEAAPGEEDLAGPITVALLNFVVIKSVLSSEFNLPIAFIYLGFLVAIGWRQQRRSGAPVRPIWSASPPALSGPAAIGAPA